jgi:hypothetical protein
LVREAVRDYRAHHDRQRLKNDNLYQAFVRKAIAIVHERCPRITLEAAEVTDLRRWPLPDLSLGVEVFFCDAAEQMRELWPRPRIVRRSR